MPNSSVVVLVSGGLDSCVLLAESAKRYRAVWPVYIRQGLAWENVELYWLKRFLKKIPGRSVRPLRVLHLPMGDVYGVHWSTGGKAVPGPRSRDAAVYLPGRNLVLSVKAAIFAALNKIPGVAIGSLDHNPFPDATPRFFTQWGKALSAGLGTGVRFTAPYRQREKWQLIRRAAKLPLFLSFSCISPKGQKHCGRCNKCVERRRAFKKAGVSDQTVYAGNGGRPEQRQTRTSGNGRFMSNSRV